MSSEVPGTWNDVLDREKQLGVVNELTEIIAAAAGDPTVAERTCDHRVTRRWLGHRRSREHGRRYRRRGARRAGQPLTGADRRVMSLRT
jgi:hypothetical protein